MTIEKRLARSNIAMLAIPLVTAAGSGGPGRLRDAGAATGQPGGAV